MLSTCCGTSTLFVALVDALGFLVSLPFCDGEAVAVAVGKGDRDGAGVRVADAAGESEAVGRVAEGLPALAAHPPSRAEPASRTDRVMTFRFMMSSSSVKITL
ncbi:hypothetical protein CGZ75_15480 [Paenibacillus herberti]|uniref:Uncharacterized protein n=1 Tax=Paenibacillus herberti TaxID=1619309 RepID=A0A229NWW1_9BACL|nr:hypothetical protein CGZ75_15480 [Paenibacillus herberti]